MIATVIPFFLLAKLADDTIWQYGPEYKFYSAIGAYADGFENNTILRGINVTHELTCRPKNVDTLSCGFKHVEFTSYEYNKTSDQTVEQPGISEWLRHFYEEIPFEVNFDATGVRNLVVEANATQDFRINLIKSVANLLNVGTDLSKVKFEPTNKPLSFKQRLNFLLGQCDSRVGVIFADREEVGESEFDLDLVPPVEQLGGRELLVGKWRNDSQCVSALDFFWSGLILDDLKSDRELNVTILLDHMRVRPDQFHSMTDLRMQTLRNNERITVREGFLMILADIYPAKGELKKIENSVLIPFKEKVEDENSIRK